MLLVSFPFSPIYMKGVAMFDQRYMHFNQVLVKYQYAFRKKSKHPAHHFSYGRKILKSLDNSSVNGKLLTNLSKEFDCLRCNLLIAKLATHGFWSTITLLHFSYCYLSGRTQRIKWNNAFKPYPGIKYGAICDLCINLFMLKTDILKVGV